MFHRATLRRPSALAGIVATVAGSLIATVGHPATAHAATPQRQASGWITYWQTGSTTQVANNGDLFSDVSVFWFHAASATSIVPSGSTPDSVLQSTVAAVRSRGVPVTITVTDGTGSGVMASILSNPTTRTQHEQALLALATRYGASGIDLDYENMAVYANSNPALVQPTRTGFDALVQELSTLLHQHGMILAVDVMSKTSEPGATPAGQVYDYPTIGRWADRVRIMTYDQHSAGSAYPGGPISSISWVQTILNFAVTVIPPRKIFMGVPLYGYDWASTGGRAKAVTYPQVVNLVAQYHATPRWSAPDGEPYVTYTDASGVQHSVWYNDANALQARLPLVGKYGLGGVAFWSFGDEDPGIWSILRAATYGPNPFGNFEQAVLWPGGVRLTGWAIDPNTASSINVDVYVDRVMVQRVLASGNRPDVGTFYYVYGSAHGFDTVIPLHAGTHTICVYGINVGPGDTNSQLGCRTVTMPTNNPVGNVETAGGAYGVLTVSGWTLDPDTADPIFAHVYVDGQLRAITLANGNRPDVAAAFPGWGAAHGFSASVTVTGGTHTVCVYGINVGFGPVNPQLGCKTVSVSSGNPVGNFESVTGGLGTLTVSGWTIDPNTPAPIDVHVYVDGRFAGSGTANANRPDVGAAFPSYGPDHGFAVTVGATSGTHTVCVYAINVGPGEANPPLGCRQVSVANADPIGHLDTVTRNGNQFVAQGWAIDPNTADPIDVVVYYLGGSSPAATGTADLPRPDVAAVFPAYGPNHGFAIDVPAQPGGGVLCAFGLNVGPGDSNGFLGCLSVPQ